MLDPAITAKLDKQREAGGAAREFLNDSYGGVREEYRTAVNAGLLAAIETLTQDAAVITGGNSLCEQLLRKTGEYVDWMKWALWDLPDLAIATRPDLETFRRITPACAFVYLSGRILDDFLDRHYSYRGVRSTLLAFLSEEHAKPSEAEGLAVLAALLLCFQGLHTISPEVGKVQGQVIDATRRLLLGIVMERSGSENWDQPSYERLIRLKNVDYWRILYAGIDPELASPLYPFLCDYYALAQKVNDIQDYARDEEQGRPNFVSVLRRTAADGDVSALTARAMAEEFLRLGDMARELPELERAIALSKLGEMFEELWKTGVFAKPPEPGTPAPDDELGLIWHSHLEEFVARGGPDVLAETDCPVCGANAASELFRKQGFPLNRCRACTHVYVNPRLKGGVRAQLSRELDGMLDDPFLGIQRVYAESICRLLRRKAPGPRLLDIGFGSGHLLRAARAHGFQVYGIETSAKLAESMAPLFAHRISKRHVGEEPLPWGNFDVIVMSHVLEHLDEPGAMLEQLGQALRPGGVVYLAVPDIDSLQYRIFGKRWDAINPVAHLQFFNEASLASLLKARGFEVLGRVRQPPLEGPDAQPFLSFFRRLGGDESGELALLAAKRSAATPTPCGIPEIF